MPQTLKSLISPLFLPLLLTAPILISACESTPDVEAAPVIIRQDPIQTCQSVASLSRVVIPPETETYYGITSIDNPPYEPIERTQKMTRIIKPAQVVYVDTAGREIFDICDPENIQPPTIEEGAAPPDETDDAEADLETNAVPITPQDE